MQSWTSTGYFLNSTGSFVTNCRFSPIIDTQPLTHSTFGTHINYYLVSPIQCVLWLWIPLLGPLHTRAKSRDHEIVRA